LYNDIRENSTRVKNTRKIKKRRKIIRNFIITLFLLLCVTFAVIFANDFFCEIDNPTNTIDGTHTRIPLVTDYNDVSQNEEDKNWNLILVNAWNDIPDDFTVNLMSLKDGYQIDERIYLELQEMMDAARSDGIYPLITSAYRTQEQQQLLLTDKINNLMKEDYSRVEAEVMAKAWIAMPGTSEHQIGLALDINAEDDKCKDEEVYAWLKKYSYKYGFILRYPENKIKITGINFEPWHFRYVGKEAAEDIYRQGICLEEYLSSVQ